MDYDALYKLTHGIYVLGARDGERYVGSVVDAVMQVANKPWVIALSCHNNSYTKECIEKSGLFSLSVLGRGVEPFVVANFGFQSSREIDKWDNVDYCIIDKLPYLNDNLATLACKVLQKVVFESNTLFVAEVFDCSNNKNDEPLTYLDYRTSFKEKVIKSFNEKKQSKEKKETPKIQPQPAEAKQDKHWVCSVCDYVYDEATPFAELPEDWICPVCGVDKGLFHLK